MFSVTVVSAVAVFPTKSFIVRVSFVVLLEISVVIDFLSVFGTYFHVLLSDTIFCNGSFAVIVTFTLPLVISSGEYTIDSIVGLVSSNSTFMLLLVANWCAVELDLVTIVRFSAPEKEPDIISIPLSGIITLLRFVQFVKSAILVTFPGIIISFRLVHSSNVDLLISLRVSGKFTSFKLLHLLNMK